MDGKVRDDEIEIDLQEIVGLLLHWAWLIIACGAAAGIIGLIISKFILVPQYRSTTSVYILSKSSNNDSVTLSDTQLATTLTKDYERLITSRSVAKQVLQDLELEDDYTYDQLVDRITVSNVKDTRIINITVQDEDPEMAQLIANAVREVSAERIQEVMSIEAVNMVDEAELPTKPSEPSVRSWTFGAAALGMILAALFVLARFMLDDTIRSSEDIEKYLGLSTLALIPDANAENEQGKRSGKRNLRRFTSFGSTKEGRSASSSHNEDDVEIIDYNEQEG
ncbi:MAG: Wzz/FepE/Etk N-terminal domain-containing protein [Bacteroidales bacterium]|nr:Wzz/FepE/Etk N-terminal domain-containing protein [Lachnoclostridium sp.]MCM1384103.1 Wzz/FepE/Etk N-terminal domain-containing protein [Lachnoclostridium sp.]MCM1465663.1 Wzz/FepE/Etk N-terminal domain-containing protein [Bacteroidales bacterium]